MQRRRRRRFATIGIMAALLALAAAGVAGAHPFGSGPGRRVPLPGRRAGRLRRRPAHAERRPRAHPLEDEPGERIHAADVHPADRGRGRRRLGDGAAGATHDPEHRPPGRSQRDPLDAAVHPLASEAGATSRHIVRLRVVSRASRGRRQGAPPRADLERLHRRPLGPHNARRAASRRPFSSKNRRRPTLPGGCPPSTIGAGGLNFSVRNGKRCFPAAMTTGNCEDRARRKARAPSKLHSDFMTVFKSRPRVISTGPLNTSLCLHVPPINVVVSHDPYSLEGMGGLISRWASRLDAFSGYPIQTWLISSAVGTTTDTPEVCSSRSSRTRDDSSQASNAHGG